METASTWTLRQLMSDPYRKTANLLLRKSIEAVSQYLISKTIKFPYKKILHKTAWCAISSHEKLWKIPPLVDSNTILILSSQSQLRLQDDNCVLAPYTVVHFGDSGHLYFWQTRQKYKVDHDLQAWLFTGTAHGTQTTFHLTISIWFYRDGVPVIRTPEFPATWLFAKNEALYYTLVCRTLITASLYRYTKGDFWNSGNKATRFQITPVFWLSTAAK